MGIRAFTLIELLMVIAIIGILASVLFANLNEGSAGARDAQRKADLRILQNAIELYKQKYKRYPEGCNGANNWSGQKSSVTYKCTDGKGDYIRGNTGRFFSPEFIPALPSDPKLNGNDSGYIYTTNADGTVYKLMVKKTVETETVTVDHQYESCDISTSGSVLCEPDDPPAPNSCDLAICDRVFTANSYVAQTSKPNECEPTSLQFQTSYGVWGGYGVPNTIFIYGTESYRANTERLTEAIACKI